MLCLELLPLVLGHTRPQLAHRLKARPSSSLLSQLAQLVTHSLARWLGAAPWCTPSLLLRAPPALRHQIALCLYQLALYLMQPRPHAYVEAVAAAPPVEDEVKLAPLAARRRTSLPGAAGEARRDGRRGMRSRSYSDADDSSNSNSESDDSSDSVSESISRIAGKGGGRSLMRALLTG